MNYRIKDKIIYIFYIAFAITLTFLVIENITDPWLMFFLSALLIASYTFRNFFIYNRDTLPISSILFVAPDYIFLFLIGILDSGSSSIVFFYLVIADIILNYSFKISLLGTLCTFLIYSIHLYFKLASPELIVIVPQAILSSIGFIAINLIMHVIKYVLKQNETIQKTLHMLMLKTSEQENTYNELMQAYSKLEEMTILKERNRIAREIHDTLGHTITTILVEMEACRKLIRKDMDAGMAKFGNAQEQMRKGLSDLRSSVRLLSEGHELVDFSSSIQSLIEDTKNHTSVIIRAEISNLPDLSESLKKTLYRALQEGLTNGIKHGNSSAFIFKLLNKDQRIHFFLQDNGKGCSSIIPGFGLKAMSERVKEQGGSLEYYSEPDEGFTLKINIPV
ncbi:MAG: sensor histidine kinase [Clostridia bacterium]|nr:sensor histidine kinase [Clostridia bacterium]